MEVLKRGLTQPNSRARQNWRRGELRHLSLFPPSPSSVGFSTLVSSSSMSLAAVRARSSLYASSSGLVLRQYKHAIPKSNQAGFDRYRAIHSFFTRPPTSSQSTTHTNSRLVSGRVVSGPNRFLRERAHISRFYTTEPTKKDALHDHNPSPSCSKCSPSRPSIASHRPPDGPGEPPTELQQPANYENYPRFFRRLAMSLPHLTRPTREDFLNAANGFVERMRVRFRWFFIRNFRKFNADDISAFITWFLMSQGLWILVGT